MPIAHNLNKVTKALSKSRGAMHVKGRKFKQLNRATLRDKKITAKKATTQERKDHEMAKLFFLQKLLQEDPDFKSYETFTLDQMKGLIEMFISRFDEELETYRNERRPGRPQTNKHQILEEKVKHEKHIYDTGFEIPDLSDKSTVEKLREWNGTTGGTTVMKFIHITKDMTSLPTVEVEMK